SRSFDSCGGGIDTDFGDGWFRHRKWSCDGSYRGLFRHRRALDANLASLINGVEGKNCDGIQPLTRERVNDAQSVVDFMRLLVRAVGSQRVEGVGHGDDPRQQRDVITFQAMRITAAVERFMVQFDSRDHLFQLRYRTKNVGTLGGVGL